MHYVRTVKAERRNGARIALRAAFALGCALFVGACNTDREIAGVPDASSDYRLRHPITLSEGNHTLKVFIGANRGSLTPMQRAQVLAFAQTWKDEATGGVIVDLPVGAANTRSSGEALREIESILAATGVPPQSMVARSYPVTAGTFAPVRITYPKVVAEAGPCGLWPKDIGPSMNRDYYENQPPWNFGCSTQRNLAAMVANPEDLVQPRAETPVYTMRRTTVVEKYREGSSTGTQYSTANTGKITTVGQ